MELVVWRLCCPTSSDQLDVLTHWWRMTSTHDLSVPLLHLGQSAQDSIVLPPVVPLGECNLAA